jgi:hypothetical protein
MSEKVMKALKAAGVPEMLCIRNLAHDPLSRVHRRLRPGNRTGFLLEDGTRIRRHGGAPKEISVLTVLANLDKLVDGVENRYVEITDPTHNGTVVSTEMLKSLKRLLSHGLEELVEELPDYPTEPEEEAPEREMSPEADKAAKEEDAHFAVEVSKTQGNEETLGQELPAEKVEETKVGDTEMTPSVESTQTLPEFKTEELKQIEPPPQEKKEQPKQSSLLKKKR